MNINSQNTTFSDAPFPKTWELLRPFITQFNINEEKTATEGAAVIKATHKFNAGEDQYKYHFRKWKIEKNLPKTTKRKLLDKGEERPGAGKRTAFILGDIPVDARRLL